MYLSFYVGHNKEDIGRSKLKRNLSKTTVPIRVVYNFLNEAILHYRQLNSSSDQALAHSYELRSLPCSGSLWHDEMHLLQIILTNPTSMTIPKTLSIFYQSKSVCSNLQLAARTKQTMSHFGRSGPPDISDTYYLLILNISFRKSSDIHVTCAIIVLNFFGAPLVMLSIYFSREKNRQCLDCVYAGTTADDLFPLFDKYGKVVDIFIPKDRRYVV